MMGKAGTMTWLSEIFSISRFDGMPESQHGGLKTTMIFDIIKPKKRAIMERESGGAIGKIGTVGGQAQGVSGENTKTKANG